MVENGKLVVERPRGILSKLGGPGVLIVGPGNAVVLERGLQITRVLGAGTYKLLPGENFKQPLETKGIIDLRVQFIAVMVENALTRDGFSLAIKMRAAAQVEPASVTAKRPPSSHGRGKVTSIILGAPEYPVHRTTLLKVAYSTPDRGWRELLDQGSVAFLRDTVATYNVGDIIVLTTPHRADQDQPIISQIETKVKNRLNSILSTAGIWVENLDLEVSPPEEVSELMRKRWRARIERQLKIEETDEAEQEITSRRGGEQAQLITQEAGRAQKETAPSRIALVRLWRTLETRFDEGEFRGLCFGLNVGYDVLPGDGLANKARELVQYLERRDRTFELVEMGNELRPDIPWLDIFHGQAD
ncbi:MAG: SPFH domain-containing protein [Anaerolineae bacterium]|nr:SPFH domain-containing protein [Anaerolineae bacterium]